jgi:subtilisin family serine protease
LEEPAINHLLREKPKADIDSAPLLDRFLYLHLPPGLTAPDCLAELRTNPYVEYCELDHVGEGARIVPDDMSFFRQWHHAPPAGSYISPGMYSPEAWEITTGSSNTIVAVLDSGIDTRLRELAGRVMEGYNFVSNVVETPDPLGHGTAVAGIIAANANNLYAGAGIDWYCQLLPVKVINDANYVVESWVAQGVDYAVSRGAKVINASVAAGQDDGVTVSRSISNAIAAGVIFVCASGNIGSGGFLPFPARYGPAIAVGATDRADIRASFSNYGPELDVVAPGKAIATILPNDQWPEEGRLGYFNGTSAAAPMASGICSLLASIRPDLTQEQARILLGAGAEDQLGDAPGGPFYGDGTDVWGWDERHGWGRVNAYFTLLLATTHIDRIQRLPEGPLELSWVSPPNARTNLPFAIEVSATPSGGWLRVTNGVFRYETNRTWWTEPVPPTISSERYYRVRIVLEQKRAPRSN